MKVTHLLMGMPITIEVIDSQVQFSEIEDVFEYFKYVDNKFSTYKSTSEISRINRGDVISSGYSKDMDTILNLCEDTKLETDGYFDIVKNDNSLDPSGLVKGWAIKNAAGLLKDKGFNNYYVDAGGDVQIAGLNDKGNPWQVGIRNPFNRYENIKILSLSDIGIATSGTSIRGQHIYNPKRRDAQLDDIVSLTVIGPDVYEADRFATAAFSMQRKGILFLDNLKHFAAYMIDHNGIATFTQNFTDYVSPNV